LDAGDQFQGTLFYAQFKSNVIAPLMNALGYDAMAVGNHEFDDGPSELAKLIDAVNFPVLSANIDASAQPSLTGKLKASTVVTLSGVPVGIIGLTAEETPILSSPGPSVTFGSVVNAAQAQVNLLEAQGINHIIGLTHLGYNDDLALGQVITGVDVIIGGHSHTFLYTPTLPINGDTPAGPYPTVVTAPDGNPVLVASAYQWGRYLGDLQVSFTPAGTVESYSGNPIFMTTTIAQDPAVTAILTPTFTVPIEVLRTTGVGTTTQAITGTTGTPTRPCRQGECMMGNLVTEAMLWKINSTLPVSEEYQIAFENGGGLRANIDAGQVTIGEVMEVLPFGNTIATMELTGTHILLALENGVSQYASDAGRFAQVAGLRYVWDPSKPVGSRIVKVEVWDNNQWQPISTTKVYRVVTNNFMRTGGDGYSMFLQALNPYDFGPQLDTATMDYFAQFSPYTPSLDGRVTKVKKLFLPIIFRN
jgi:5'-nucleotidase/UDP-sugar diphosphatase